MKASVEKHDEPYFNVSLEGLTVREWRMLQFIFRLHGTIVDRLEHCGFPREQAEAFCENMATQLNLPKEV